MNKRPIVWLTYLVVGWCALDSRLWKWLHCT